MKRMGFIGFFWGAFAFCAVQEYRVSNYPKGTQNCHEVAASIGIRFENVTGIKPSSAICEKVTQSGYQILVRYEAEKELSLVSTSPSLAYEGFGAMATYTQCQAVLPSETEHFKSVTGLEVVVSYCMQRIYNSDFPWVIRIDGFGEPNSQPFAALSVIFGLPIGWKAEAFSKAVVQKAKDQGIDARFFSVRSIGGYWNITLSYYDPALLSFTVRNPTIVDNPDQCQIEAREFDRVATAFSPKPLATLCIYRGSLGGYEVNAVTLGKFPLAFRQAAEIFSSFEACDKGRARLVDYYKNTLHRPVAGLLCAKGKRDWNGVLLEE